MVHEGQEFTTEEWDAHVDKNADDYKHYWDEGQREMDEVKTRRYKCPPENYYMACGVNVRTLKIEGKVLEIVSQAWETYTHKLTKKKIIYPEFKYNFTEKQLSWIDDEGITVDLSKLKELKIRRKPKKKG
jgi:hypothetical protein